MSCTERFVQHHKRATDHAIHGAYAWLSACGDTHDQFHELLQCARQRAPRLLEAPVRNGRHPGVDALLHLARFRRSHIRSATDWIGASGSWRTAVASLARHLICEYPVPMFLSSCWHEANVGADKKRRWFVAHSRGASFRSLDLPLAMTRRMEHLFLRSQDHLSIDHALRTAEMRAMGASTQLVDAVLRTRLAADFRHADFWRTVWMFFITNASDLDLAQVGPLIDYMQGIRHDRVMVDTPVGRVEHDPAEPTFSVKGRSIASMMRLMREWHKSVGLGGSSFSWTGSSLRGLVLEEPVEERPQERRRWQIVELTNSGQLRAEGAALHHCVASYAINCYRGVSSIWALRLWRGAKVRHVLTMEVDARRRVIVQARGYANRRASGKALRLLRQWAFRERLQVGLWF